MVATWRLLCRKFRAIFQPFFCLWFWILSKMVRQRKGRSQIDSSKDHFKKSKLSRRLGKEFSISPVLIVAAACGITLCGFGGYKFWSYKLSSRLYTPLNVPLVINRTESDMSRFWGSYRSNLYFGMRLVGAVYVQSNRDNNDDCRVTIGFGVNSMPVYPFQSDFQHSKYVQHAGLSVILKRYISLFESYDCFCELLDDHNC